MGFITPDLPDVDYAEFMSQPRWMRLRTMSRHWVEHGFGTPPAVYLLYVLKMTLYVGGVAAVISLTPGLGGLSQIGTWWSQPIVYQKVVVFTLLFEVLGLGCGFGPLTMRFLPPVGGCLYWLRPGTIRLPAWPDKVPFTRGDERNVVDVALYLIVLASGVWALLCPGRDGPVTANGDVGLVDPKLLIPLMVALPLLGLRDKTVFLAARAEHYWLTLFIFFFPFTDQVAAYKLVMLALWWGAATSKLNHHFPYVVSVMISNDPLIHARWFKRAMYRDPVDDLRPSWLPKLLAHIGGTVSEFVVPLYLVFFSHGGWLTWIAIGYMTIFHLNIISTVPMGVPLEWNIFFVFSLFYLFGHYASIRIYDLNSPVLLIFLTAGLVCVPISGNIFPRQISFLSAMRYYAGNWATSIWAFGPGAEEKIEACVKKSAALPVNQLTRLYGRQKAEMMIEKAMAWRAMHAQGRALNGLLPRAIQSEETYSLRDGEAVAGPLIGWNFGEGHLHNEQLLAAVQKRCNFEEGEVRMVALESQPIHQMHQSYRIYDAKTGLIEEGYVYVHDLLGRQPWTEPGDDLPTYPALCDLTVARKSLAHR